MVTVPTATPVITPELLIDASDGLLLLHVPPVVASVTVAVDPVQTPVAPPIGAANIVSIVTTLAALVALQVPCVTTTL
jgi:hypothetical protein